MYFIGAIFNEFFNGVVEIFSRVKLKASRTGWDLGLIPDLKENFFSTKMLDFDAFY